MYIHKTYFRNKESTSAEPRLLNVNDVQKEAVRSLLNTKMTELLTERWPGSTSIQEKQEAIVNATKEVAQEVLPPQR